MDWLFMFLLKPFFDFRDSLPAEALPAMKVAEVVALVYIVISVAFIVLMCVNLIMDDEERDGSAQVLVFKIVCASLVFVPLFAIIFGAIVLGVYMAASWTLGTTERFLGVSAVITVTIGVVYGVRKLTRDLRAVKMPEEY